MPKIQINVHYHNGRKTFSCEVEVHEGHVEITKKGWLLGGHKWSVGMGDIEKVVKEIVRVHQQSRQDRK